MNKEEVIYTSLVLVFCAAFLFMIIFSLIVRLPEYHKEEPAYVPFMIIVSVVGLIHILLMGIPAIFNMMNKSLGRTRTIVQIVNLIILGWSAPLGFWGITLLKRRKIENERLEAMAKALDETAEV